MKPKKTSFLEWNNKILAASLKRIDLNIFLIVFLDALFYATSGLMVYMWLSRVIGRIDSFNVPVDPSLLEESVKEERMLYITLVVSFIVLLMAIIFLASVLKGIIWAKTTNTRVTFAFISRFLILNLVWMSLWFVLILALSIVFYPPASSLLIGMSILINLCLSNTLYSLFMKGQRLNAIPMAIKISFAKAHMFILPYIVIGCSFFVVMFLSSLINLDQALLMFVMGSFNSLGGGVLSGMYSQEPLIANPGFPIMALTSIMVNPLLLLLFGFARYYHSELVSGLAGKH